jgi:hypothetical protein
MCTPLQQRSSVRPGAGNAVHRPDSEMSDLPMVWPKMEHLQLALQVAAPDRSGSELVCNQPASQSIFTIDDHADHARYCIKSVEFGSLKT